MVRPKTSKPPHQKSIMAMLEAPPRPLASIRQLECTPERHTGMFDKILQAIQDSKDAMEAQLGAIQIETGRSCQTFRKGRRDGILINHWTYNGNISAYPYYTAEVQRRRNTFAAQLRKMGLSCSLLFPAKQGHRHRQNPFLLLSRRGLRVAAM